jgi:deoxyribonuclease V
MNLFSYTYELVKQIPDGMISSYGAVAKALGDINASRAVGHMMNQNPDADSMPCYKIVHSDGRIGGFGLGIDDKIRRLKQVGITVKNNKIVDFNKYFFRDFKTNFPLIKLKNEQVNLSKKIILRDDFSKINTVIGIDVAYPNNEFNEACGAYVIMDYRTKRIIDKKTIFAKINFPYISTYLFYREFPIVKKLLKNLKNDSSIFLFDGNGVLHPRGLGFASQSGVLLDIPTIGVTKKLLAGTIKENIVMINDKKKGYVYFSNDKIKKPIYISPGNKISFNTCLNIIKGTSTFKLPEPLRQAHILAKKDLMSYIG